MQNQIDANNFRNPSETILVAESMARAVIIYPFGESGYEDLAKDLADLINRYCSQLVEYVSDCEILPERNSTLEIKYRTRPLIVLGNIVNNRLLLPLYARYYVLVDGGFPGGDGHDVRTVVNPYGTGENMILVGGSNLHGVRNGIEKLKQLIHEHAKNHDVILPFVLDVVLDQTLTKRLEEYPLTPLDTEQPNTLPGTEDEIFRSIGNYGVMYGITGDKRYGIFARECLLTINALERESYGDRHYFIEKTLLAVYWLKTSGLLSNQDIKRTDRLLLNTAIGTEDNWWRKRDGELPLGHRHHVKGTYGFLLLARYLRDHVATDKKDILRCNQWISECRTYLNALCKAGVDDQDDETTLDTLAILCLYALGEEYFEFFESGQGRKAALRALALHDNMGAGAGQGGYGESYHGAMYVQQNATTAVAASALYYKDRQLKWILESLPHLKEPLRDNIFNYCPAFLHNFETGNSLKAQVPNDLGGIQCLPIAPHQFSLSNDPPHHIEPMGHAVNAPETWQLADGIGINHLPKERCFDKITLRRDFSPESPYLLLQGYQGGFNWQGHQQAANCIVRFSQFGHIFLVQNSRKQSTFYKNGVLISNGSGFKPLAPIAAWDAIEDLTRVGITVTTQPECQGAVWQRFIFWSKTGDGFYVVLDKVDFKEPGSYNLVCTWRTPLHASKVGRRWFSEQGLHRFELICGEDFPGDVQEEINQGACNPFVLRQYKHGCFIPGEHQNFHNLFFVQSLCDATQLDLLSLDSFSALVIQDEKALAWCGSLSEIQNAWPLNIQLKGLAGWISRKDVVLAAGTLLVCEDLVISSNSPVGISIGLDRGTLHIKIDNPNTLNADVSVTQNGEVKYYHCGEGELLISIDPSIVKLISETVSGLLTYLLDTHQPDVLENTYLDTRISMPNPEWHFREFELVPLRDRAVRVTSNPPPLDGFPEQLIDTVLNEMRESWGQWPSGQMVEVSLSFPKPVHIDHIQLLGDSADDPMLRSFSPLPDGIKVYGTRGDRDGILGEYYPESEIKYASFQRFRGQPDRVVAKQAPVQDIVEGLRLRVPTPDGGKPLVLQEIEIYRKERAAPRILHMYTVDLFGDNRRQILLITEQNELIVLEEDGRKLWQQKLPDNTVHISCHDLLGDGQKYICLGLLGGELRIITPQGDLYKSIPLARRIQEEKIFFGLLFTIFEIQIWDRDIYGNAALVVGGYSLIVFLSPDFDICGHSWVDGPWIYNVLSAPALSPLAGDLWVRTGWNHGIFHYKGLQGLTPSGTKLIFGGVEQAMFRELLQAIPFANGPSVAFNWVIKGTDRYILAAAEGGIGILDPLTNKWLWKILGTPPITACILLETKHNLQVVTAGLDGFIRSFRFFTGKQYLKYQVGMPIIGLHYLQEQKLWIIATSQTVFLLDENWNLCDSFPYQVDRVTQLGNNKFVIATKEGDIVCFHPEKDGLQLKKGVCMHGT